MAGKVKIQISNAGGGQGQAVGRVRVLRQVQQPGGAFEGGTEITDSIDPKKGFETELNPRERIVIEEIG